MSIQTITPGHSVSESAVGSGFHVAFIVAWLFCLPFYFAQYAVRSASSVMVPELTTAFGPPSYLSLLVGRMGLLSPSTAITGSFSVATPRVFFKRSASTFLTHPRYSALTGAI